MILFTRFILFHVYKQKFADAKCIGFHRNKWKNEEMDAQNT